MARPGGLRGGGEGFGKGLKEAGDSPKTCKSGRLPQIQVFFCGRCGGFVLSSLVWMVSLMRSRTQRFLVPNLKVARGTWVESG